MNTVNRQNMSECEEDLTCPRSSVIFRCSIMIFLGFSCKLQLWFLHLSVRSQPILPTGMSCTLPIGPGESDGWQQLWPLSVLGSTFSLQRSLIEMHQRPLSCSLKSPPRGPASCALTRELNLEGLVQRKTNIQPYPLPPPHPTWQHRAQTRA